MQQLFSAVDGAMARVSSGSPRDLASVPWPGDEARDDPEAWPEFIAKAWASSSLPDAVGLASPSLAAAIGKIRAGAGDQQKAARAGKALARYMVRLRGRATPFGLFAGVAPARIGPVASGTWGTEHRLFARADGRWLAALVTSLEADSSLCSRLKVTASDVLTVRGDRIIVGCLPRASELAYDAPAEISFRRTPAVEAALGFARTPVTVSALSERVAADFAQATAGQVLAMISQLIACGALVSELRPPSTSPDGLGRVIGVLRATGAGDRLPAADLEDVQSAFLCTGGENLDAIADRMRELVQAPAHPVAVDLRADCDVTIPRCVADEAAKAASALTKLSPCPHGMSGWTDYRSRFNDRYGLGTVIPVAVLLDPVAGLGLPSHYSAPSVAAWGARDERLAVLAQQAALDGAAEIDLGGTLLRELAGPESQGIQPVPHMDITVDLRAGSLRALNEGAFTVSVCGVGRTAVATSGRFLHLLSGPERERLGRLYRDLPTATRGALTAQLSFPPRHPRTENVTSVPPVLPCVLSLGEYHGQHGPARIPLDDLAVTASSDRLHLISLSRRMPVEPVLACAPAWHVVPPVARLLFELPRAHCPPAAMFSWGAAASLPFVPRLRLGRVILSPARWRIRTSALPGPRASQKEWTAALERLRDKLRLPEWISAGQGDRQLRLSLDQPMDLAVLRAHLDASESTAVLAESWAPDDHAWCGGRAHEIVIPLTTTTPPAPPPKVLARRGPFPGAGRDHGHLPGSGRVLSARLYSDPALFDLIVTEHLPALTEGWDDLSQWWFIRYRDPRHHLRLRLHAGDCGDAAARIGRWAEELRHQGLVGDLALDTYRPETGRFGTGRALAAAETYFSADSAAAAAQLASTAPADPKTLTAASLADLAGAFLGGRHAGMRWLADHPIAAGPEPLDPDARRQALAITGPEADDVVPADVRLAWNVRANAAGEYAELLAETGRDPAGVLETLLHLHHNRVHGPGAGAEAVTYRLARACALRHTTAAGTTRSQ